MNVFNDHHYIILIENNTLNYSLGIICHFFQLQKLIDNFQNSGQS